MKISKKTANAKINLGLQVLQKRIDGYHNINTVFAKINLCDFIEFVPSAQTKIHIEPYFAIELEDNLIYKAIQKFNQKFNNDFQFDINLIKNIPSGAGLGGGSSDAATTLLFLNEFSNNLANKNDLHSIAMQLGSDVPFFLEKGMAVGNGRGEILDYFTCEFPYYVLIVNPGIHISTPLAYKKLNRNENASLPINFKKIICENSDVKLLINDFEDFAMDEFPQLLNIKNKLNELGAELSLMSGSGSTMFGLFNNIELAQKARTAFPEYFTYIAEFVD